MRSELFAAVKNRLDTLLAGVYFDDPVNNKSIPNVLIGDFPEKRAEPRDAQDIPFVLLRIPAGTITAAQDTYTLAGVAGLYAGEPGAVENGERQVELFDTILKDISKNKAFIINNKTYRLTGITTQYGNEAGEQDHPYYFVQFNLQFVVNTGC